MFQEIFKEVVRLIQECFNGFEKEVLKKFQPSLKAVSGNFKRCLIKFLRGLKNF